MGKLRLITRLEKEQAEVLLLNAGLISPAYTLSSASRGRVNLEDPKQWRTCFELDRGRIVYSHAYRRLRDKAQVYMLPLEANLTTRLIHTEEVVQIACSIAGFLGLNKTLTEAITRGHDIGHTPFGHFGELVFSKIMQTYLGDPTYKFHHAKYGLEIVDRLEKDGKGLNLTYEVRDGILKHTLGSGSILSADKPFTLEGQIVMLADKVQYICGDIDDSVRIGALAESDLPQSALKRLGVTKSNRIATLITAIVDCSIKSDTINFCGEVYESFEEIRRYMYMNVYGGETVHAQQKIIGSAIERVFDHVMHEKYADLSQEDAVLRTLDDVACMTDVSLTQYCKQNFVPHSLF